MPGIVRFLGSYSVATLRTPSLSLKALPHVLPYMSPPPGLLLRGKTIKIKILFYFESIFFCYKNFKDFRLSRIICYDDIKSLIKTYLKKRCFCFRKYKL